jgi:lysozyme
MQTSPNGIALIKEVEGLILNAYLDTGKVKTIGYGHVILEGQPLKISEKTAERYLAEDIKIAEKLVNRYIRLEITSQNQYDALVSFAFNLGRQGFVNKDGSHTGIRLKHNAGLFDEVPEQFLRWKKDNGQVIDGLINRRKKEIAMYRGER